MFKKIGSIVAILGLFLSSSAFANAPKNKSYVGLDVEWNHYSYKDSTKKTAKFFSNNKLPKSNLPGIGVFGGYRWDCLGAEIGVNGSKMSKFKSNAGASVTQKNYNVYLDGNYYHALTQNLDLKALVGMGYLTSKFTGSAKDSSSKIGARAGAGVEYYFTKNVSSSLMYKFQTGNKFVKNLQNVALGVAYHF